MAKAASPIRLEKELMQAASLAGRRLHRSAAEQVEYWASLGRRMAEVLDPDTLLEVASGLARLRVEPVAAPPVDPEAVFAALEARRRQGALAAEVTSSAVRYQASRRHPGWLERLDADGRVTVGQFKEGVFIPGEPSAR